MWEYINNPSSSLWAIVEGTRSTGERVGAWMRRHRRKLIIMGVLGGTAFLIIRFAQYKLRQFQNQIELREKALTKMRMQSYFESAQRSCNQTVIGFIDHNLKDKISEIIEIPSTSQLRSTTQQATKEQKLQLWEQIKIAAFTRALTSVYTVALLTLFVRVEVNILGRYLYMTSSIPNNADDTEYKQEQEDQTQINEKTKREYLNFVEHFLNKGIVDLAAYIRSKIEEEMVNWPVNKKYEWNHIATLLASLRMRIEGAPNNESSPLATFHQYLLPAENDTLNSGYSEQLVCLLNETRDVLESEKFISVLRICLNFGYQVLASELSNSFKTVVENNNKEGTLPMPNIIPMLREIAANLLELESNAAQMQKETAIEEAHSDSPGYLEQQTKQQPTPSLLRILFGLREMEDYSFYIFTSSYDEE